MPPLTRVDDLTPYDRNRVICVKVLFFWFENFGRPDQKLEMILADLEETKIEATITGGPFDHDNITGLREDTWYFLSNFLVLYLPELMSNTSNMFRIWFYRPTKMTSTYERSPSKCIEPERFSRIDPDRNSDCYTLNLDTVGFIVYIDRLIRIPYVSGQYERGRGCNCVYFVLKNHRGLRLRYCTIGDLANYFMRVWVNREYGHSYLRDPVFCVLRFWHVEEYKGKPCLMNRVGCSRFYLDPEFDELEEIKERVHSPPLMLGPLRIQDVPIWIIE
ncbi:predicted protein [Arabidopsis lyrata subsp. lyrata]|uniref:Predicted protein n=1 Tax=Arabidopsis lyrata subsp. lyrata TaxID=81972 RepID=D7MJG3_ARALL|nr:predicted protein [Arabidopsis lyrata subsp. lyrata]